MDGPDDFGGMARAIIDSTLYMVLGTSDQAGQPWVTPVYFSPVAYTEFYWVSSPQAKHSHNIAQRPQVSLVIFNSQVPVGGARAVYMSAAAGELSGSELERGLQHYNGRFTEPAEHGLRDFRLEQVQPPGRYRLYRAVASEHWVLDPQSSPDSRARVTLTAG